MANAYFIGGGSGAGFGGNTFTDIGNLGPAWEQTMLKGLNTQQRFNDFQNQQLIEPYKVQATASAWGTQALQNDYQSQQLADEARVYSMLQQTAMNEQNAQRLRQLGGNPDKISYMPGAAASAPNGATPVKPAMTGSYASTSPQLTQAGTPFNPYGAPSPGFAAQFVAPTAQQMQEQNQFNSLY